MNALQKLQKYIWTQQNSGNKIDLWLQYKNLVLFLKPKLVNWKSKNDVIRASQEGCVRWSCTAGSANVSVNIVWIPPNHTEHKCVAGLKRSLDSSDSWFNIIKAFRPDMAELPQRSLTVWKRLWRDHHKLSAVGAVGILTPDVNKCAVLQCVQCT